MPQQVVKSVKVRNAQVGDEIADIPTNPRKASELAGAKIQGKDVKAKWATLETGAGNLRIEADVEISIRRVEETPEERKAAYRAQANRWVQRAIDEREKDWADAKTVYAESLEQGLNHWKLAEFGTSATVYKLWSRVANAVEHNPGMEPVDVLKAVMDSVKERLYEHLTLTSRSTSTISNVCEDIETDATAAWLRHNEHYTYTG